MRIRVKGYEVRGGINGQMTRGSRIGISPASKYGMHDDCAYAYPKP